MLQIRAFSASQNRTPICVLPINKETETPTKFLCILGLLVMVSIVATWVDAAGECGKASADDEAMKLEPCVVAAQNEKVAVSDACCQQVKRIGQNPACLCALLLSDAAKASGVNPQVAITIPKRCNLANRPVGYKCGGQYAL